MTAHKSFNQNAPNDISFNNDLSLAQIAPVGIFRTDENGDTFYVNDYWCRLVEITAQESCQKKWMQLIHPHDRHRVVTAHAHSIKYRLPLRIEFRIKKTNGQLLWLLMQSQMEQPVKETDPKTGTNSVATIVDITELRHAEENLRKLNNELELRVSKRTEELRSANQQLRRQIEERQRAFDKVRESEEKWRSLVENAPDFILTVDKNLHVEFINRVLPGFSLQSVTGLPVTRFISSTAHEKLIPKLQSVFETGTPASFTIDSFGAHRTPAIYMCRIGPIYHDNEIRAVILIARDITRERQSEEKLRRKQDELAHVMRVSTMGELATILAHELTNPLSAITTFAEVCAMKAEENAINADELADAAGEVVALTDRMSKIIRQLKHFLKKQGMDQQKILPKKLIDDAKLLADLIISSYSVKARYLIPEEQIPVFVDPIQMGQVLMNLILNAAEAMTLTPPAHRQLEVEVTHSTAAGSDEPTVEIAVRDCGCGLPDDFDQWGFQAFRTTKAGGLGIGLSISRSIVEAHGGTLTARSLTPRGAEFIVSLPAQQSKTEQSKTEQSKTEQSKTEPPQKRT